MDAGTFFIAIINAFINSFLNFLNIVGTAIVDSVRYMLQGFLAGFGIPFAYWSSGMAQNVSITLPIIFTTILGVALVIFMVFVDIYGLEKDFGSMISEAVHGIGGI